MPDATTHSAGARHPGADPLDPAGRHPDGVDLAAIARRIVALAEEAASEHEAALARSQADGLARLVRQEAQPAATRWR